MKKVTVLSLLMILLHNFVYSQWESLNKNVLPTSSILTIGVNSNKIFVGTMNGLYFSTNDGKEWIKQDLGIDNIWIYSIQTYNHNIYLGTDRGFFISTDNGLNWERRGSNIHLGYYIVTHSSTLYSYNFDRILYSTDYGFTWINITNNLSSKNIKNLIIFNERLFVSTTTGIYFSSDNGKNWQLAGLNNKHIEKLFVHKNHIYAYQKYPNALFYSDDGGNNWFLGTNVFYDVSSIATNNEVILAGYRGIFFSTDDGMTWNYDTDNYLGADISSIIFYNNVFYISTNSHLFKYYKTKKIEPISTNRFPITSMINFNQNLFVSGDFGILKSTNQDPYIWDTLNISVLSFSDRRINKLLKTTNQIYAIDYVGINILVSNDMGDTWNRVNFKYAYRGYDYFTFYDILIGCDTSKIIVFIDTLNYFITSFPNKYETFRDIIQKDNKLIIATSAGLYFSTDTLKTLSKFGTKNIIASKLFLINNHLFVVTNTGVFFTSDDGKTWKTLENDIPLKDTHTLLETDNKYIALTRNNIYFTNKENMTWTEKNFGLPTGIEISTGIIHNDYILIGTNYGVFRLPLSQLEGIVKPKIKQVPDVIIPVNNSTEIILNAQSENYYNLLFTAKSSNEALVPTQNITFTGDKYSRLVKIVPVTQKTGESLITIYITDNNNKDSVSFNVKVVEKITSIENQKHSFEKIIFPLPAKDFININLNNLKTDEIILSIYNLQGEALVENYKILSSNGLIKIPISSLPNGLFFLKINKPDYIKETLKFIKY